MTKYEDMPSAIGAATVETIEKQCTFCGERFINSFEEADHLLGDGDEAFDPHYILTDGTAIALGSLLRNFYDLAGNVKRVRELASEAYSLLLMAEFDPEMLEPALDVLDE